MCKLCGDFYRCWNFNYHSLLNASYRTVAIVTPSGSVFLAQCENTFIVVKQLIPLLNIWMRIWKNMCFLVIHLDQWSNFRLEIIRIFYGRVLFCCRVVRLQKLGCTGRVCLVCLEWMSSIRGLVVNLKTQAVPCLSIPLIALVCSSI